jgi:hypothetical protein
MRTIETTVFKFAELSESAKKQAIQNNYDWNIHDDWNEFVKDDFETIGKILGIDFATYPVKLMNGNTRHDPKIWYSGFCSQGDGACFEGTWSYSKGMTRKIREHAPQDAELHRIADRLADLQKRYFYGITTRIEHTSRYYHSHTMRFDHYHQNDIEIPASVTDDIEELLRDLADWYYSALEREYNYLTSDEAIAESLESNECEFDEFGDNA